MSDSQRRSDGVASDLCEFVKCGSCSTVFDVRSSDACPKCGAEPPDPDDDFEPDPDVDDAIAEGFGDGCPFHGDVYADHRACSHHLVEAEKWDRWLRFIRSEGAKTDLHTKMLQATKKLRGEQLRRALDTWERAVHSWRDWDEEEMRRELQPWIDEADKVDQSAAPKVGFWKRMSGRILG